jgi:hypothetical protein
MTIRRRKISKNEVQDEQLIVRGVVTDKDFVEQYLAIHDPSLIVSEYNRDIIEWCIQFFKEHQAIPGVAHIKDVYHEKTREMDDDVRESYELALVHLSEEHDASAQFVASYALQRTARHLNQRKVKNLQRELQDSKEKTGQQLGVITQFEPVQLVQNVGVDPFSDPKHIIDAFQALNKPLFGFPGALGRIMNSQFTVDSFTAFLGREKIGKTWILMEVLFKALRKRNQVAFFQCGDMSQNQFIRRMGIRCAGKSDMKEYLGRLLIPIIDCELNQTCNCPDAPSENVSEILTIPTDEEGNPTKQRVFESFWDNEDWEPCTKCRDTEALGDSPEDYKTMREIQRRFVPSTWYRMKDVGREPLDDLGAADAFAAWRKKMKLPGNCFKLSTHSTNTVSISQIRQILKHWKKSEGFSPKVVIIDYADILAPMDPSKQYRHQQNETWAMMRSISTEFACNVTTATQADSASYYKFLLSLDNFSEDKRKFSHVTAFFGLNQMEEEKKRKFMRINPLMMREALFDSKEYVTVLQALDIGCAYLDSF